MIQRRAVLAALAALCCWGSAGAQQSEDLPVTLTCKSPSFKTKRPLLVLNGTCPLSDGVRLVVTLSRSIELLTGGLLEPSFLGGGAGTVDIESKKFVYDTNIDGPAKYMATVSLSVEMQEKQHVPEVKKRTARKESWQFEFLVWGDDMVPQLGTKLQELQLVIAEARDLVKKFESACQSEQSWMAQSKPLVDEARKLRAKLETHELKAYYPAAVNNMMRTIQNIQTNAPYYTFQDGKFSGAKDYHADSKKVSTFRNEDFTWDNLKRYIEESMGCSGREFCLWIVKDLRRTAGQMRPEILDALKQQKATPGVDLFVERLQKATISDLDPLEAEIRGKKAGEAPKEGDTKK
jgi:hypothetical protein